MNCEQIITLDVHGMRVQEAVAAVQKKIDAAGPAVYQIRVIHGYHGGTRIREALREEFGHGLEPKVKRITMGENEGITELILRELY